MPAGPFTISKDFIHGTEEGCIRVTAVPHIIIYRIPHDFAQNLTAEAELKQAGIYLLLNTEANTLYVGQADSRDNGNGVLGRMLEPHTKKKEIDQWDIGFAMTSGTPAFFGATELNWLEQFFYDEALKVGRYELLNGNRPHANAVTFSTKTLLNNYTDFAFFLLRVEMGCDAFEPVKKSKKAPKKTVAPVSSVQAPAATPVPSGGSDNNSQESVLYIDSAKKGIHAEGVLLDDNKILVRKGSQISSTSNLTNQKRQAGMEKLRQQLISTGVISDNAFASDYVFTSPSTAATVILGTAASGNEKWKDKNGTSLGEINSGKGT